MKKFGTFLLAFFVPFAILAQTQPKVLIFSNTAGYRHGSIPFGKKALEELGVTNGWTVTYTENSELFTDINLSNYAAVVFNSTTGDILNNTQQAAFERYIQSGGGYVGIHSAADTEYRWPWYGELVGAYFSSHPNNSNIREATINVVDKTHPSSQHLPDKWVRTDEWYSYKNIYHDLHVLAYLDEHTYTGGTNGANHPIAWYHDYDGGRAFFTGGGHVASSFEEPLFRKHLEEGIKYAIGNNIKLDYGKSYSRTIPEENRFEKTVLVNDLNNPMELAVSLDGKVYFTEILGNFSVYNTKTEEYKLIHRFPITFKGGTGLQGITLDPLFEENRWVYLYYSPPVEGEPIDFYLSRFTLSANDEIDLASEKVFFKVPVQINSGAHHGGSLAFDSDGVLVLSTGDGTTPFPSDGYSPIDERADPESYPKDAQRSASNTNDLKGKILRIIPHTDGSYSIPSNNLFPVGTEKTKPEIYAMGVRNPYRLAINPKTNTVYWGEIGPDAGDDSDRGPTGYDEFNQAKEAGFFGWPYFIANSIPYADWDFETEKPRGLYDSNNPLNDSPNNTGLLKLPKPELAMIYYPYKMSDKFPELGLGGRSAMAGEFYSFSAVSENPNKFPAYYDGGLFVFDWMRNWMRVLRFDENENYVRSEAFMPTAGDFRRPIDLAFSKDGIMYALEYGSVYGADNKDARLVKIEYNASNRAPNLAAQILDSVGLAKENLQVSLTSERRQLPIRKSMAGKAPLRINMAGRATDKDFGDKLSYSWFINGQKVEQSSPIFNKTFEVNGGYEIVMKVTDQDGLWATDSLHVSVGNALPEVEIASTQNRSFYWGEGSFDYQVKISDEDGKKVKKESIKTVYNYSPISKAPSLDISGGVEIKTHLSPGSVGRTLIENSDCKACHTIAEVSVGPSFAAISARYSGDRKAGRTLATKIIEGGGGNWGETHVMSAHPQISMADAREMVSYIFSLSDPNLKFKAVAASGTLPLEAHKSYDNKGYYTLKTEYTDKGNKWAGPQKGADEVNLRYNELRAMDADSHPGFVFDWGVLEEGDYKAYLVFKNIDLKRIKSIGIEYGSKNLSGEIEVRKNSVGGPVIGRIPFEPTGGFGEMKWVDAKMDNVDEEFQHLYFVVYRKDEPFEEVVRLKSIRFLKE
ncbi:MAG: cytochrome c [Algoriphagus sp.]|jgi:cytochrome c